MQQPGQFNEVNAEDLMEPEPTVILILDSDQSRQFKRELLDLKIIFDNSNYIFKYGRAPRRAKGSNCQNRNGPVADDWEVPIQERHL